MWRLFNSMRDMYSNVTLVLAVVIVIVLSQVNPKAKDNPDTLPPPGSIAVLACWPAGPIDVDLWLGSPTDKPVGYSRKSGSVWALLRDDMGIVNDSSPVNCESAFARVTPVGEFTINIHGYSLPTGPVSVHVEVALNGSLLAKTDMEIRGKQERTVVRITLDGQGRVASSNTVFKGLRES
jgi:hypothetical protein